MTLARAVSAAARCAAIDSNKCGTIAQTQSYAASQAWGLSIQPSAFTVTNRTDCAQVAASYDFVFIVPWLVAVPAEANKVTLTASTCITPQVQ